METAPGGEGDLIGPDRRPISISDIRTALSQAGIVPGDVVLMHVSMRGVGWVIGGVQGLLMAVLEHLGATGTLVMPGFSSQLSDPGAWQSPPVPASWVQPIRAAMPLFDAELTPTRGIGAVAEALRALPATRRSAHVRDSFLAHGPASEDMLGDHPMDGSLGHRSPLGWLYRHGAKVLLLGAGFDSATCFHLAEENLPTIAPIQESYPVAQQNGITQWQDFPQPPTFEEHFNSIGAEFTATGAVKSALNGAARVFYMRDGVDFAREWLVQAAEAGQISND